MSNAIAPYQYLNAQGVETSQLVDSDKPSQFLYIPESEFVVNPFPNHILNLIQPLDSMSMAKGVLSIKYDDINTKIVLAKDWSTITITEYIDGVKIGVLTGSLLSTVFGYLILFITPKKIDVKI